MFPFLRDPQVSQRDTPQDFKRFFADVDLLLQTDNPFVCPLGNSWHDIENQGLRSSVLLLTQSLVEGAKRLNQLPPNLDLSRLVPQLITLEHDSQLHHFCLFIGSQASDNLNSLKRELLVESAD